MLNWHHGMDSYENPHYCNFIQSIVVMCGVAMMFDARFDGKLLFCDYKGKVAYT